MTLIEGSTSVSDGESVSLDIVGATSTGYYARPLQHQPGLWLRGQPCRKFGQPVDRRRSHRPPRVGPGEIQSSGASHVVNLTIQLAATPQPNGLVSALPGDVWYFQYWYGYSSPTGPTSNFSWAGGIRFEP